MQATSSSKAKQKQNHAGGTTYCVGNAHTFWTYGCNPTLPTFLLTRVRGRGEPQKGCRQQTNCSKLEYKICALSTHRGLTNIATTTIELCEHSRCIENLFFVNYPGCCPQRVGSLGPQRVSRPKHTENQCKVVIFAAQNWHGTARRHG